MAFSMISDVHIQSQSDLQFQTLMSFFNNDTVLASEKIFLLGDIFDLMVGPHKEYYQKFPKFFEKLSELLNDGKEIHYFEGNHDLHLKKLFQNYFKENSVKDENFHLHTRPYVFKQWNKSFFFAHGDEIEIGNYNYKLYKSFITTYPLKFVANYVMPYKVLHHFGEKASDHSREEGAKTFDENKGREAFRLAALNQASKGYDYIICGHSHIKDEYQYKGEELLNFTYLNNGYSPSEQTFLHIHKYGHNFVTLGS